MKQENLLERVEDVAEPTFQEYNTRQKFDRIVSMFSWFYIGTEPRWLSKLLDLLSPKGTACLVLPNASSIEADFNRSFSPDKRTTLVSDQVMNAFQESRNIFTVELPRKRPFQWHVFVVLVALYFLGNLAGIPLLRKTNVPIEPVWLWGVATVVSALMIALSLAIANRTGLGAPLLEGRISKEDLPSWLRSGLALTVLMLIVGFPLSLIANLGADPATYPFGWELFPASFKAGVVEEMVCRLFLVSLFVWLGSLLKRDDEGRPTRGIYWAAIVLAALIFGWAHVDARLSNPAVPFWGYVLIMVLSTVLGSILVGCSGSLGSNGQCLRTSYMMSSSV